MSTFGVFVRKIDEVIDHPNADRLSICKILGFNAITNKDENGNHRYSAGDLIVYVPEAAIVPEQLLKRFGYWNDEKDMGLLAGTKGDRVKAIVLRKICSQGLVWPIRDGQVQNGDEIINVREGSDVMGFFGITKYEPQVPSSMGGEVASAYSFAFNFDVENYQNFPGFLDNDEVEAVEKIHGSFARICYRHLDTHPELFADGHVGIASKGLGAKGLIFKNNEKNASNLYVRTFLALDLVDKIATLGQELAANVDLFGEIFGSGVQDLTYGAKTPEFRAFDIAINGRFLPSSEKEAMFFRLGVKRAPVVYRGPWDMDALIAVRDGKTELGGGNIREGVVVTATGDQSSREWMGNRLRPMLKMVSPAYLTRKGDVTEYQ